ncbi:hypothetical protein K6025_02795 [Ehrlichia sp. JZT12]
MNQHFSYFVLFIVTLLLIAMIAILICLEDNELGTKSIIMGMILLVTLCEVASICWVVYNSYCVEFKDDSNISVDPQEYQDIQDDQNSEEVGVKEKSQTSSSIRASVMRHSDSGIDTDEDIQTASVISQDSQVVESQDIVPMITYSQLMSDYKAGAEYVIFIPFTDEELTKIDVTNNIVSLRYKRNVPYIYITQSYKSHFSKTVRLKLSDDRCKILESREELNEIDAPGLSIWIKDGSKVERVMKRSVIHFVICPEIVNGVVSFNYYGNRLVKDRKSLRLFLLDTAIPFATNKYELLLKRLLTNYPDDRNLVYPEDEDKAKSHKGKFWIDTYKGKLTVNLLGMFGIYKMLSKNQLCGSFYDKIKYLLDYIKKNITVDDNAEIGILKFISCNWYVNRYSGFNYHHALRVDARLTVGDLIYEDFEKDEIYKYIFSIASYPYIRGNCVEIDSVPNASYYNCECIESHNYIVELLTSHGFAESMYELIAILSNCYDRKIKCGSSEYEILKVHVLLESMLKEKIIHRKDVKKEYTGKELIDIARAMIETKYMTKVGIFHDTPREFTVQVGRATSIVLVSVHSLQLSRHGIAVGNVTTRGRCNSI